MSVNANPLFCIAFGFMGTFLYVIPRPTKGLPYGAAAKGRSLYLSCIVAFMNPAFGRIPVGQTFGRP